MKDVTRIDRRHYPPIFDNEGQREESTIDGFLSPAMCSSLIDPSVQQTIRKDTDKIYQRGFQQNSSNYLGIQISFDAVSRDEGGFSFQKKEGDVIKVIPGLIGLDYMDDAATDVSIDLEPSLPLRVYCGINIGLLVVKQKFKSEKFFRTVVLNSFGVLPQGISDKINNIDEELRNDEAIRSRHHRIQLARIASGLALSTIFDDKESANARLLLEAKYKGEFDISSSTSKGAVELLKVDEAGLPADMFPATTLGFATPLDKKELDRVLRSKIALVKK